MEIKKIKDYVKKNTSYNAFKLLGEYKNKKVYKMILLDKNYIPISQRTGYPEYLLVDSEKIESFIDKNFEIMHHFYIDEDEEIDFSKWIIVDYIIKEKWKKLNDN